MITRWNIAKNKFKILEKKLEILEHTKNVRFISNFFPGFLKELEVRIVSTDDNKLEYGLK